jgi:hypothetical protein
VASMQVSGFFDGKLVEATVIIPHALIAARCRATAPPHTLIVIGLAYGLTAGDYDRTRALRHILLSLDFTIVILDVSRL